ncbi:hypothetical protein V8E53_001023 [Lactarius tabidus]
MHSYETLAVIVLALSTATPAFSAPVRENQQQVRASLGSGVSSSFLKDLLKAGGGSALLGAAGTVANHFFSGGNSTRRDTELTPPTFRFDGLSLPISNDGDSNTSPTTPGLSVENDIPVSLDLRDAGLEEAIEVFESLGHSRREPLSLGGVSKGVAGLITSTAASDIIEHFLNHTRREPEPSSSAAEKASEAFQFIGSLIEGLVKRQLEELD